MDDAPVPISCFTQSQIMEMENSFEDLGEGTLGQEFCQGLATKFSGSPGCFGNMSVGWKEVQDWFQNKQKELPPRVTTSPVAPCRIDPEASMSNNAPQNSIVPRGDMVVADLSGLKYEAKSSKDDAWYDVAAFLTYRVRSSGELEARVRFSEFGNEEDEWVNVKQGIRKRSIPLEPSDCGEVRVGDLVLCFQERSDRAVHCDAHIIEIHRGGSHEDGKSCSCTFRVRYDHDNGEVNLVYTKQADPFFSLFLRIYYKRQCRGSTELETV